MIEADKSGAFLEKKIVMRARTTSATVAELPKKLLIMESESLPKMTDRRLLKAGTFLAGSMDLGSVISVETFLC